ncbi:MAG: hypothetical protein NC293_05775 [Roseburia sp.]|nr:hypothetical protein [Roseburia sp.]
MKNVMKRMTALCLAVLMMVCTVGETDVAKAAVDYSSLATDLPLNGIWSGEYWMTDTDKEDYYRITIPSDGKLTFKVMSYMSDIEWGLYTQDWSNQLHGTSWFGIYGTDTTPTTEEYSYSLSAGTYYLKVYTGNTGRYKMYGAFTSYNTTDAGANSYDSPLNLGEGVPVTGAITDTDKEDWYRINVPATGSYTVKITAYTHVDYNLYNWDLSKEITDSSTGYGEELTPDTKTWDYILSAGTYYIKISYGTGKYILSWSALTPENCTHSYESSSVYATYLSRGYTLHTCTKCGHQYKDNYRSKLVLGQASINYLVAGKRKITVNHWGVSYADGFEIRYSRNKKFKTGTKIIKVKGGSFGKRTLKKLSRRKRYYVQMRAYKKVGSKTVYGKWSAKKSVKVK